MDFILGNLKFHRIDNLKNLDSIKDDDFWNIEMPMVIELVHRYIRDIESKITILTSGYAEVVDITNRQCFVVLGCMFLGILPKQMHEEQVHFGDLMTRREVDNTYPAKAFVRIEKLKCIIAYFKHIARNEKLL